MEDTGENRFTLAVLLACPACVGGFLLPFGAALGTSAKGLQAAAGLLVLAILGASWARNAWARRHEDRVPLAPAGAGESAFVQAGRDRAHVDAVDHRPGFRNGYYGSALVATT